MPGQAPAPPPSAPAQIPPPKPAVLSKPDAPLRAMTVFQLYDLLDTIDEREHRDSYWRVNHEIARRKLEEDQAMMTEARELRASINQLKLALEELIGKIRVADVVPL